MISLLTILRSNMNCSALSLYDLPEHHVYMFYRLLRFQSVIRAFVRDPQTLKVAELIKEFIIQILRNLKEGLFRQRNQS